MKMKSFFLFFLCLFLVAACSDKEIEPSFAIENSGDVVINPEVGSTTVFSFTSSREWKASCSADWLSVSPLSGESGKASLTVTAKSANSTTVDRSATIVLSSGTVQKEITLTQEAGEIGFIDPDLTEYRMPVEGGVLNIGFSTNMEKGEFAIYSSKVDWVNQNVGGRAVSDYGLSVNILANTGNDSRSTEFTFVREVDSKLLATVKVVQAGKTTTVNETENQSVSILQTASNGNGIPIIFMGDGFTQQDINDGLYADAMNKACENIFTEEPIKSLRDYFDVYAVTAVSRSHDFTGGSETVLRCKLEGGGSTTIEGNDRIIQVFAQSVRGVDLTGALIIVILNTREYAGTTQFGYSLQGSDKLLEFAIAYCPIIDGLESEKFRQVLTHEGVGHGFAKLDDEYAYEKMGAISADRIAEVKLLQAQGWLQNVDFTPDRERVLWSEFLKDSRYALEGLGVFEGACTYIRGAYRSSEESMMRKNTPGFNAPCRKEIYDRVIKRGTGYTPTYEEFVAFDMLHKPQVRTFLRARAVEEKPFARPRLVRKALNF